MLPSPSRNTSDSHCGFTRVNMNPPMGFQSERSHSNTCNLDGHLIVHPQDRSGTGSHAATQ